MTINTMVSLLAPADAEVVYMPDDRDAQDAMRRARYVAPPPIELGEIVEAKLRQELGADYREPPAPSTAASEAAAVTSTSAARQAKETQGEDVRRRRR